MSLDIESLKGKAQERLLVFLSDHKPALTAKSRKILAAELDKRCDLLVRTVEGQRIGEMEKLDVLMRGNKLKEHYGEAVYDKLTKALELGFKDLGNE